MNELDDNNFEKLATEGNVVLDFYADWCGPCKAMSPLFQKMSGEFKHVKFFKINVEKSQDAANNCSVRSIPTIVLLKNGEELDRIVGMTREDDFKSRMKDAFTR